MGNCADKPGVTVVSPFAGQTSEEAVRASRKAVASNPKSAAAHYNLSLAYHKAEQHEDALDSCREAIRLNPSHSLAHNNMGVSLHALGRYEEAVAAYKLSVKSKPNCPLPYSNMGEALQQLGKVQQAVDAFKLALGLKWASSETLIHLASALETLGRKNEAKDAFNQALKLNPHNAAAKQGLQQVTSQSQGGRTGVEGGQTMGNAPPPSPSTEALGAEAGCMKQRCVGALHAALTREGWTAEDLEYYLSTVTCTCEVCGPGDGSTPPGTCHIELRRFCTPEKARMADLWLTAYHGTTQYGLSGVLRSGHLLKAGDATLGGDRVSVRGGHISRGAYKRRNLHTNEDEVFDPRSRVFASPSYRYSTAPVYAKRMAHGGGGRAYNFVLQLQMQPGTFLVGQETVGASTRLDPAVPNESLEWYSSMTHAHLLTAVVMQEVARKTDKKDKSPAKQ
eukprot:TRINITY_DN4462_c0_g2_i1.p1 TRINITY_DN4462_c0_g2~~TRINITY_DN4462_c0_g2_i1.p1  ORF type:complete len:450 (+),score=101.99 TRINITY_DN4462_c0_g2_i1:346-1695(+)